MMTKRATIAAATAVFAFAAGAASASTYSYDIDRQTMWQWTGLGSQNADDHDERKSDRVFVHLDINGDAQGGRVRHVEVGGYALNATALNGGPDIGDFVGWCIDLFTNVKGGRGSLDVNTASTGLDPVMKRGPGATAPRVSIDAARIAKIENLFETNYPLLTRTNTMTHRAELAGFQVAIWELLYENSSTAGDDVSSGSFQLRKAYTGAGTGVMGSVMTAANTFLGNMGGAILADYDFTYFTDTSSNPSQNLVTVTPPPAVPLPAPALMLLGGLGALSLMRHRKA